MTIGEKIKSARESAGLTQEELGRRCGTTKQTIYKYEIGKVTNIPLDRLKKIAAALNTTSGVLLGEAGILELVASDNGLKNAMQFFEDEREEKGKPTPVSESGSNRNVLRLAGRDGSYVERNLTDEQMAAIKMMIEQLPDADDL